MAGLKAFDGRACLSTYLALVARDILAERLARRFSEAPDEARRRFARFFWLIGSSSGCSRAVPASRPLAIQG
jgi:hypothetical protein